MVYRCYSCDVFGNRIFNGGVLFLVFRVKVIWVGFGFGVVGFFIVYFFLGLERSVYCWGEEFDSGFSCVFYVVWFSC